MVALALAHKEMQVVVALRLVLMEVVVAMVAAPVLMEIPEWAFPAAQP